MKKIQILLATVVLFTACGTTDTNEITEYPYEFPENSTEVSDPETQLLPVGIPLEDIETVWSTRLKHSVTFDNTLVAKHASVPDIIELEHDIGPFPAGTWLMYFNDTTLEKEVELQVGLIYSIDDGQTWSDRIYVPVSSEFGSFILADVSIIELEDGTLRLYFYGLDSMGDHNKERVIYSSISNDGLAFEIEAEVYKTFEPVNNPEVVYHDGLWYLFLTIPDDTAGYEGSAGYAVSSDPHSFEGYLEMNDILGIIGADSNGEDLYVYGCSPSASEWLFNDGFVEYLGDTGFEGCDPAPFFDSEGDLHMATKVIDHEME